MLSHPMLWHWPPKPAKVFKLCVRWCSKNNRNRICFRVEISAWSRLTWIFGFLSGLAGFLKDSTFGLPFGFAELSVWFQIRIWSLILARFSVCFRIGFCYWFLLDSAFGFALGCAYRFLLDSAFGFELGFAYGFLLDSAFGSASDLLVDSCWIQRLVSH